MIAAIHKISLNLHKAMAVPAFLLFAVFFIYPLCRGIGLSLTDWNGVSRAHFIGLSNFISFFHDKRAMNDIVITVLFALGSTPLLNLFGLLYALILDKNFRGRSVVRAIVYLPAIISPLIMGYIWYDILQPERGFLAKLMSTMGLSFSNADWFTNAGSSLLMLITVNVWQYVGMTMVVYLAGLQSVPPELYEAGKIDGCSGFASFRYITFPMIKPSVTINVVTNIIGSLSVFDIIMSLTGGGPGYSTESLSIYIMRMCYGSFTGYSTAVAIILFLIILVPVVVYLKLIKFREFDV